VRILTTALAAVLLAACATTGESGSAPVEQKLLPPAPGFSVRRVPDGFGARRLLASSLEPPVTLGDMEEGVAPFRVVVPEGWTGDPEETVIVALVDQRGGGSRLEVALPRSTADEPLASTMVRGRQTWRLPGRRSPAGTPRTPQVVVRINGDLGVRVQSLGAPMSVLDAIAARVGVEGQLPKLGALPDGWHLEATATATQLGALGIDPAWSIAGAFSPGYAGCRVMTWRSGARVLKVALVAGRREDLAASGLARVASDGTYHPDAWTARREGGVWWARHHLEPQPDGRVRGGALERVSKGPGDTILYVGAAGYAGPLPTQADLTRIAESVRVDDAGWDAAMQQQRGAPPDVIPGHTEIVRGRIGDVEWLVEDRLRTGIVPGEGPRWGPPVARVEPFFHLTGGDVLVEGASSESVHVEWHVLDALRSDVEPGRPAPYTALLVMVGPDVAEVAVEPDGPRVPTVPAPEGRVGVIIPGPLMTANRTIARFDAQGRRLPD
jgi:hypothetical protein